MDLGGETLEQISPPSNGGAGMNVTFILITAAMFLQIYTSQWFQNMDLDPYRLTWTSFKNSLSKCDSLVHNSVRHLEMDLEATILETNWTDLERFD